jgi:hypothetical protein
VVLGIRSGDQVEILEGVLPGEMVVTQGHYQLQFAAGAPKKEPAQDGATPATAATESHDDHSHAAAAGVREIFTKRAALLPLWAWMLGAFALGGFVFGFLLRKSGDPELPISTARSAPRSSTEARLKSDTPPASEVHPGR